MALSPDTGTRTTVAWSDFGRRDSGARAGGLHDKLLFLRGLLASPAGVSAVAPSSRWLARALAAQIDLQRQGPVLELGPGTGAVTQAILARGIAPSRLTVVEYDPQFAALILERFPGVRVMKGDALNLRSLLGASRPVYSAIMSGLPLINFSPEKRKAIVADGLARLQLGAPFIQVSYRDKPAISETPDISIKRAAFVWRNIPPGYVWVYRLR